MFELKRLLLISTIMVLVSHLINTLTREGVVYGQNWPQWRGPHSSGACPEGTPPIEWNEHKNIIWKVEIPGKGYSTPIIWGDQIFLTTTIETNRKENAGSWFKSLIYSESGEETIQTENVHEFFVLSVNRKDGKIIWRCKVREQVPLVKTHHWGSWASNSVVTDGVYIYAYFGSHGLYCLDLRGNILWERDFGKMNKAEGFGEGSSPYTPSALLVDDLLYFLKNEQGRLTCLDAKTGKEYYFSKRLRSTGYVLASPVGTRKWVYIVGLKGKTHVIKHGPEFEVLAVNEQHFSLFHESKSLVTIYMSSAS